MALQDRDFRLYDILVRRYKWAPRGLHMGYQYTAPGHNSPLSLETKGGPHGDSVQYPKERVSLCYSCILGSQSCLCTRISQRHMGSHCTTPSQKSPLMCLNDILVQGVSVHRKNNKHTTNNNNEHRSHKKTHYANNKLKNFYLIPFYWC